MELKEAIHPVKNGTELEIIVSPNSSRRGIEGLDEWRKRLIIRVKAPPLDGKANKEVEEVLEEMTGLKCSIIRGQTGRQKTVFFSESEQVVLDVLQKSLKE